MVLALAGLSTITKFSCMVANNLYLERKCKQTFSLYLII